ncbi:MAG: Ni/Fe hydrogenase subunit gamma [Omnitrophica WOR_2 bacterium RIFCSPHIGHO2_02_FULL_50_17]|nr:MAG: Ni/Fe hydrogenase subunit gamma [Omnitrophica WOR_2 bacterium RIFCSPHIGHO2_02_FULL_50_17]
MTDPMVPSLYRVARFSRETHDTFTIVLRPQKAEKSFTFAPGQFNMLYMFGAGEVPVSISGNPLDKKTITHTIRAVGNVTQLMRQLKTGDRVGLRGPFGSRWPISEASGKDAVIVAGGIGLAPLRPVVYQFFARRKRYRRVTLLYGTRTPEDILYKRELKRWRAELDMDVHVTVDRATGSWRGNVDVVPALIPRAAFEAGRTVAMVCGPEVMMHFTVRALKERGLGNEDIYVSMERNMKCAVGFCGHCQYGPYFICKDGPVFRFDRVERIFRIAEI